MFTQHARHTQLHQLAGIASSIEKDAILTESSTQFDTRYQGSRHHL